MNPCDDKLLLLQAFVDDELDAANAVAFEQHLKTCPGCAHALAETQSVRQVMATPGLAYDAPEAFRRRLAIAVETQTRGPAGAGTSRRRSRSSSSWLPSAGFAGVAAALLLAIGVQRTQAPLTEELVADHIRSLQASHLTDVQTSNRHVVKPWFDGKVPFAPSVVDFADKGFSLVGGRLDYVDNHAAAALVYRRRLHVINVFVWPMASAADKVALDRGRHGYTAIHWSAGGLNYWAVSDLDPTELRQFRDLYRAALRS